MLSSVGSSTDYSFILVVVTCATISVLLIGYTYLSPILDFFFFLLSEKGWEGETRVATPQGRGAPAITCSASELVPPIERAQLIGRPFEVTPTHGRVVQHHNPTKVQAGQMVPNTQHLVNKDYYGGERGWSFSLTPLAILATTSGGTQFWIWCIINAPLFEITIPAF